MCKVVGLLLFFLGSLGLMWQQWLQQQERSLFLQAMNQSLLRLHQSIAKGNLPIAMALAKELSRSHQILRQYYEVLLQELEKRETLELVSFFLQACPAEMRKYTKEEERSLWVQALCSLFFAQSPGEDAGFYAYYDSFYGLVKGNDSTKKERQKITMCTTGMALVTLLLLLL